MPPDQRERQSGGVLVAATPRRQVLTGDGRFALVAANGRQTGRAPHGLPTAQRNGATTGPLVRVADEPCCDFGIYVLGDRNRRRLNRQENCAFPSATSPGRPA